MDEQQPVLKATSYGGYYIGGRRNNEDCVGKNEPGDPALSAERGWLYVVCDGMGGHAAGEVASRIAVETVLQVYYGQERGTPRERLSVAIGEADEAIAAAADEDLEREDMGCTIVAVAFLGDHAVVAHVGDSRAYLHRGGELQRLTRDHLFLLETAGLSEAEIAAHPRRHVLSRALGMSGGATPDFSELPLQAGDRLLLATDGLTDCLSDELLARGLGLDSPAQAVEFLLAAAREHHAEDNSSAVVVFVDADDPDQPAATVPREVARPAAAEPAPSPASEPAPQAEMPAAEKLDVAPHPPPEPSGSEPDAALAEPEDETPVPASPGDTALLPQVDEDAAPASANVAAPADQVADDEVADDDDDDHRDRTLTDGPLVEWRAAPEHEPLDDVLLDDDDSEPDDLMSTVTDLTADDLAALHEPPADEAASEPAADDEPRGDVADRQAVVEGGHDGEADAPRPAAEEETAPQEVRGVWYRVGRFVSRLRKQGEHEA